MTPLVLIRGIIWGAGKTAPREDAAVRFAQRELARMRAKKTENDNNA